MPAKKKQSLKGRSVVVTRAADQSAPLVELLKAEGADVIELPLIQTSREPVNEAIEGAFRELWSYEWLIFTSPNGVRYFFEHFFAAFDDIRALGGARIAAIGRATLDALHALHLRTDVVPEVYTSEALAGALVSEQTLDNLNILIVAGNLNGDGLKDSLEKASAIVDSVSFYRTEHTDLSQHPNTARFRRDGADAIVFASGSAVESFVSQAKVLKTEPNALRPIACSIGPVTAEAMKKRGLPVDVVADEASAGSIVDALAKHFSKA